MIRSLRDHKQFKIAKVFLKDIDRMLKAVDESVRMIEGWKHYLPMKDCLNTLKNNRSILESHKAKYLKVVEETAPRKDK